MSYNGSGTFNINSTGQPVVAGTVITASAFNALTTDLATGLTTAITKDGQTTTTARITFAQGITSSLVTDSSSVSTGSIITAGGAGIAKNLYVGGIASFSAQPIFTSLTASSAVATDASKGLVSVTNTGTGNNVLATSPTLVTPILGTPQSGTLTSCTGLPNAGLVNSSITIGGTAIALGASSSAITNDITINGLTVGKGASGGADNTVVGYQAGQAITSASRGAMVGWQAGYSTTTGAQSTYFGAHAGYANNTGNSNTAVGDYAFGGAVTAGGTNGSNNSAFGQSAMVYATSGGNNTAIGVSALQSNTSASNNTAVGFEAGKSLTTGAQNYFFGYQAGQSVTTGTYNVLIGAYLGGAAPVSVTGNNWIVFSDGQANIRGYHNPSTNGWFQSNNSASWSTTSDQRIKTNIVDSSKGLAEIAQLRVRNFKYKTTENMPKDANGNSLVMLQDSTKLQTGFIAQEIQTVFPEAVQESENTILNVQTDAVFYAMVKAIQELKAEFDAYKATHP
jgi:hypothetical protein